MGFRIFLMSALKFFNDYCRVGNSLLNSTFLDSLILLQKLRRNIVNKTQFTAFMNLFLLDLLALNFLLAIVVLAFSLL